MIFEENWAVGLVLLVGCVILNYIVKSYAHRRAIRETVGILTNIPTEERYKVATMMVDLDIKNGTRI